MDAALVDANGLIVNVILLDEGVDYTPAEGLTLVFDPSNEAEPGGSWDGQAFHPKPAPPPKNVDPEAV